MPHLELQHRILQFRLFHIGLFFTHGQTTFSRTEMALPGKSRISAMKAPAVSPYIYMVQPEGRVRGFQVRFKRRGFGPPPTISRYFSVRAFGTAQAALNAAEKWREANLRWLTEPSFVPRNTPQKHPILELVARARRAAAVAAGTDRRLPGVSGGKTSGRAAASRNRRSRT